MENCKIILKGSQGKIIGIDDECSRFLHLEFMFPVKNAHFARQHRPGWDGTIFLYNRLTNTFDIGLLPFVVQKLNTIEQRYIINDERRKIEGFENIDIAYSLSSGKELRDYQREAVDSILKNNFPDGNFPCGIINIATNGGKCQPLTAKILTPNGYKTMGDIKKGDQIIGDDGKSHLITEIYEQGSKDIFRIMLKDGTSTMSCDEHLWAVQNDTDRKKNRYQIKELKAIMSNLTYGIKNKRLNWSIPVVKPVEFNFTPVDIHPWLLGFLIGDGYCKKNSLHFSTAKKDILEKVIILVESYGDKVTQPCSKNYCDFNITGGNILKILKKYSLCECKSYEKFIPPDYLINSLETRLDLLRGLNDSDGFVNNDGNKGGCIEYSTTSKKLSEDIKFLVESMGGTVKINKRIGKYKKGGEQIITREQYRIFEIFYNKEIIPVASDKHLSKWKPRRKGNYKFIEKIEYIGKQPARCIYIDNPTHLYITDDFIVTHNTTIAACIIKNVLELLKPDEKILFLTHSKEIALQTQKALQEDLGIEIGFIGDGKWEAEPPVNIAIIGTLHSKKKRNAEEYIKLKNQVVGYIGDECHHSSAYSWYEVMKSFENAYIRVGLTGTIPEDDPVKRFKLHGVTGSIRHKISNQFLVENGYSAVPVCRFITVDKPKMKNITEFQKAYETGIVENAHRNNLLIRTIIHERKQGNNILVLVERLSHGETLIEMLSDYVRNTGEDIGKFEFTNGGKDTEFRKDVLEDLRNSSVNVLVATSVLDEGVDVENINCVIYGRGKKSPIKLLQGIGRGLRKKSDGSQLYFYDFLDLGNPYLANHSNERFTRIRKEKFKIEKFEPPEV